MCTVTTALDELSGCDVSITAKLIAVLEAAGITAVNDIQKYIGRSVRRIQAARQELRKAASKTSVAPASAENDHPKTPKMTVESVKTAENGIDAPEMTLFACASVKNDRASVPEIPPRIGYTREGARARIETPSGLLIPSTEEKIPPTPQEGGSDDFASRSPVRPVSNWNTWITRPEDSAGVAFVDGKVILDGATQVEWLGAFGGDREDLKLALIAIARQIQPNSRTRSLKVQVESALASRVAERRDRDRRYASAAKSNGKSVSSDEEKARRMREMMRR